MATINILIAVDAAMIAEQVNDRSLSPGSQGAPTSLGAWSQSNVYICMITQSGNVNNNSAQGQSELNVNANSGDTLEWAITTFDNDDDYTAFLYTGTFNPATAMTGLNYIAPQTTIYLPPSGNPTGGLTAYTNQTSYAQATVIQTNVTVQYTLSFAVVNNETGAVVVYFSWDPFITVAP